MKPVGIFYFSGTGNTKLVAEMIREEFIKNGYEVDLIRIEDVLKGSCKFDPGRYGLIGIGCQVIGYSVPNIMYKFLRKVPEAENSRVFIFRTAGGVGPVNYNASNPVRRKLTRKGYEVFHERMFSIGSNWINKFDTSVVRQLYLATQKKVAAMCGEVINGQKRVLKTGLGLKLGIGLAAPVFSVLFRFMGKDLKVSEACTHCGLCVDNCPAGNIYEKNHDIRFKLSCNCCLRCVYSCPQKALSFKRLTFIPVTGGYDINKILNQACEETSGESATNRVPLFFNEYVSNGKM